MNERTNQLTIQRKRNSRQTVKRLARNVYVRRRLRGDEMDDILSIFRSINDTRGSNGVALRDRVKQEGLADAKVTRHSP